MPKAMKVAHRGALEGFADQVDELVRLDAVRANADAKMAQIREILDPVAIEERRELERQGVATKQVSIKGTGKDARYTFRDAYKALPDALTDDLRTLVGPLAFGQLFTMATRHTMRADKLPALLAMLGDRLPEFFDVTHEIVPAEDFGAKRAAARAGLSDAANEALDAVIGQIGQKPALSLK